MSTASDMVTTIDTAISNIVSGEAASVTVDGESYSTLNLDQLIKVRDHYQAIVAGETATTNCEAMFGITGLSAGAGK